ncbi:MAG TPA: hypothetical protein PLC98_15355 [Anaerolineales bacterium]|nr:hypothetical protein [Anaerolineales bacterium]
MTAHQLDRPLFRRYPLTGEARLSTGPAPTPYHVYAGYGAFVGGHADSGAVAALLRNETVEPLLDTNGRALMGVWALDFTEASLGPHEEVQVSFFVTRGPAEPVRAGRMAATEAFFKIPNARLFCHGLWNSTARVVAYNREHLGLNARLVESAVSRSEERLRIEVQAGADTPGVRGDLQLGRASLRATFEFASRIGFGEVQRLNTQPWVEMKVVNPIGLRQRNDAALTGTRNAVNVLRYFDPGRERLSLSGPGYADLDFRPTYVQQMEGFTFVYLDPAEDA